MGNDGYIYGLDGHILIPKLIDLYALNMHSFLHVSHTSIKWFLKIRSRPWLAWLSGLSAVLQNKAPSVRFPVRARAWVASHVPSRGYVRGNHTLMFLSLFLLPFPSV